MQQRALYIAAYDVSDDGRLRDALRVLKGYASGRQKSVFECFLTEGEKRALVAEVRAVLDGDEDRFFLVRVERRSTVHTLGKAVRPLDLAWYYVG